MRSQRNLQRHSQTTKSGCSTWRGCLPVSEEDCPQDDLKDHKRPDGRAINQIRPLAAEVDLIPRVHGSAMFTRGQTQICDVVTLSTAFRGTEDRRTG